MITGSLVYISEIYFEMGYLSPLQRSRQEKVGEETGGVGGLRCECVLASHGLASVRPCPSLADSWFQCLAPILHHALS